MSKPITTTGVIWTDPLVNAAKEYMKQVAVATGINDPFSVIKITTTSAELLRKMPGDLIQEVQEYILAESKKNAQKKAAV